MTRKDYMKAAQMVQKLESGRDKIIVTRFLVDLFAPDNPRFDARLFVGACGHNVDEFFHMTGGE